LECTSDADCTSVTDEVEAGFFCNDPNVTCLCAMTFTDPSYEGIARTPACRFIATIDPN
jgi:hypothetical protein